ncbi:MULTISPECIES: hypothetical protein [Latilactobacillus]|uniref:hypothetical protein n=1 Tax=Latilactobacillus TaxID=2767885 RepID=UPI0020A3BF60|nr:hypothetical protein [Latilactobacillus curvatus]UTC12403.1 hypothetical protein A4W75_04705 [Latilactobacillus curvatus]
MRNYLITFMLGSDFNSDLAIDLRSKIEDLSKEKWIQIFPNQVAIQSESSLDEIYKNLEPVANKTRVSIVEFSNWMTNESRSTDLMKNYGY